MLKKYNTKEKLRSLAMMAMMNAMLYEEGDSLNVEREDISKTEHRESHPWDEIHLTKAERKNKTYGELQAMRRSKYAAITST